ncbi:hypothetical protein CDO26_20410 (plasmid) [Sinorhizobium meliloti]|nr:hypothetical protein CDO26_20410 [Sinorhizobium meliloti]MQW30766.1 hypothetical protein [Sinorhizobium meliloti]RVG84431.1 hypothetical protein CN219_14305 [Sinorhizobium meliloti]RVI32367.1 hypothetical protein CN197_19645 [Sinorhizobium meliloti]RVI41436.1 hypothetical protein CN196_25220 [Sinorhizobium meliloti]
MLQPFILPQLRTENRCALFLQLLERSFTRGDFSCLLSDGCRSASFFSPSSSSSSRWGFT